VHIGGRLAVEVDAAVALMVGGEPAEAPLSHLQAHVLTAAPGLAFRQSLIY